MSTENAVIKEWLTQDLRLTSLL